MLTCYRTRRRIGAYLDGALGDREAARATAHIASCARCHAELDGLRRLSELLRRSASSSPIPVWTGFWAGVRHGIEDPRVEVSPSRPRGRRRLVVGTAAALAVMVAVVLWQAPRALLTPRADAAISVDSADTDHPRGTVMIYSPPEKDLAVVWVFDLD